MNSLILSYNLLILSILWSKSLAINQISSNFMYQRGQIEILDGINFGNLYKVIHQTGEN